MQGLEEIINDDNIFWVNGIKGFIKDYEKGTEKIFLKEKINFEKEYDSKKATIKYIRDKRNSYKEKILSIENNIIILNNTLNDLEFERNLRAERIKEKTKINNEVKESLQDIVDAIEENKKIILFEEDKIIKLREDFKKFNDASLEEEKKVYVFFNYIKREYIKFKRNIVKKLNSNALTEGELILAYEFLLIITKKMICIEEDLLGG